ncbi:hypothetical protein MRS44_018433 [Fusarium solani]|uniref:uncharacterized protein n=1 Tax=Fusarium solani TaxID=169388 RepID=UPI0032C424EA|nr:hypothetical protein MRS44_018433 [Fusarium solani]
MHATSPTVRYIAFGQERRYSQTQTGVILLPALMLAHPHRDPNELRKIDGVEYDSYASAAEFCYGNHRHPDDYYGTPNAEERRPDPDEFEEEFHEPDLLETGLSLPASFPTAHQAKR